jgi:hypothetical protein
MWVAHNLYEQTARVEKTAMSLPGPQHLSSADRFGAGWINDRYSDRNMKVLRQWIAHFLARPGSA